MLPIDLLHVEELFIKTKTFCEEVSQSCRRNSSENVMKDLAFNGYLNKNSRILIPFVFVIY